jgi:methionine aminotransferase
MITSKLPNTGTTIFTVMTALAQEHGAINLSQGFPNYSSSEVLVDLVYHHMRAGHNQYAPMAGLPILRRRLSEKIAACFGASLDPETEITITAGATQALFTAIAAFVGPGDEVILLEPAYDSYRPSVEVMGGKAIAYELSPPHYRVDWEELASLISPRTRMIIINTPHNPTGSAFSHEDMRALEVLTDGTNILVLSDEVYEHLIYDGRRHESVLRYPGLRARSLSVYSFGKTFHNTGWKVGYCLAPPALTREFRKVHQFNVFSVNTPVQHALADFLANPSVYQNLPAFYQRKRDVFTAALQGARLEPLPCAGTYFHLFDYRSVSDESDRHFAERLTKEFGVAVIPVSVFYTSGRDDGIIRICFAKTDEMLAEAGARLRAL